MFKEGESIRIYSRILTILIRLTRGEADNDLIRLASVNLGDKDSSWDQATEEDRPLNKVTSRAPTIADSIIIQRALCVIYRVLRID